MYLYAETVQHGEFQKRLSSDRLKNFSFEKEIVRQLLKRECMNRVSYALTVGSIIYIMTYMRSDMAYSLGVVSRYYLTQVKNTNKL